MLQQTQVVTVVPYFERWLRELPGWRELARASEEQVLRLWEGLGYYHRARRLQLLAQTVMERFGGEIPSSREELEKLPGLGPYTAAAVAAIAFNQPELPIDGNIRRVLARFGADGAKASRAQDEHFRQLVAPELRAPDRPRQLVQALMELGALVCKPRQPECRACPLRQNCRALAQGHPERYPAKKVALAPRPLHISFCWAVNDDSCVLLRQRPEKGRFPGHFEPPLVEAPGARESQNLLAELLGSQPRTLAPFRRDFTTYRVTWHPHVLEFSGGPLDGYEWVFLELALKLNLVPVLARHLRELAASRRLQSR